MRRPFGHVSTCATTLLAFALLLALLGCSPQGGASKTKGCIEGTPPYGWVSNGTELVNVTEDGGWEWTWDCQEKGYSGNYVGFDVERFASGGEKTAAEIFGDLKQAMIERVKEEANVNSDPKAGDYSEILIDVNFESTSGAYMDFSDEPVVGILRCYPNLGDQEYGVIRGEIKYLRAPKCIVFASIELRRWEPQSSKGIFDYALRQARDIKILDNK